MSWDILTNNSGVYSCCYVYLNDNVTFSSMIHCRFTILKYGSKLILNFSIRLHNQNEFLDEFLLICHCKTISIKNYLLTPVYTVPTPMESGIS